MTAQLMMFDPPYVKGFERPNSWRCKFVSDGRFDIAAFLTYADVNPETGRIVWKRSPDPRIPAGSLAGKTNGKGYLRITFRNRVNYVHRIVFYVAHGHWPRGFIDHINGNRADNRVCNIRECTASENQQNRKRRVDNTSGITGVAWSSRAKKWIVRIYVEGRQIHRGAFTDIEAASVARKIAERELHPFAQMVTA